MRESTQKTIGLLVTALVFLTFVTVKASGYSVSIEKDTSAFPAVNLNLEINGNTEGVFAQHVEVIENGVQQQGPLVWLPPATPNKKVNLFIMLDRSGNTEPYREVIQKKLESLIDYFEENNVDIKIHLSSFGNNDTATESSTEIFAAGSNLRDKMESLNFESGVSGKIYGLERLENLAEQAEKNGDTNVLLLLNASPFYEGDEETTKAVGDVVSTLIGHDFSFFVVGHPFKTLHSLKSAKTPDSSLSHSVPGGYLGSFSTDLTVIYDLLQNRDPDHFTLYYISDLMPGEASGANVSLFISGNTAGSFNYPEITKNPPIINDLTATSVMSGDALPIQLEVNPSGKMVSEVELAYVDNNESIQTALLKKDAASSTPEAQIFEGEIPAGNYPEGSDSISYVTTIYTPYDKVGGDEPINVDVDLYDDGITVESQLQVENGTRRVKWWWHGPTVDMGIKYEIWAGDYKLEDYDVNSREREYTVDLTDCSRYQIVKVRVFLRDDADHPLKGGWSLFSRPGEFYDADPDIPQDSFIESFAIDKMIECLHDPAYETRSAFVASQPGYKSSSKLYLNRMLYYLTAVLGQASLKDLLADRYSLLYFFMDYLSQEDYDGYGMDQELAPLSLLYKMITQVNQTEYLDSLYEDSMEELSIRLHGNISI